MPSVRSTKTINYIAEIPKNQVQKQNTGTPKNNVESWTHCAGMSILFIIPNLSQHIKGVKQ